MFLTSFCNHKIRCRLLLQTYPWSSSLSSSSSSSSSAFVSSSYRRFSFVLFSCLAHSLDNVAKWTFRYRNSHKRLVKKINIFHILNPWWNVLRSEKAETKSQAMKRESRSSTMSMSFMSENFSQTIPISLFAHRKFAVNIRWFDSLWT